MKLSFTFLIILFVQLTFGQKINLAKNGSLEYLSECPTKQGNLNLAYDFYKYGSADVFSVCGDKDFGVPNNALGTQWSADGYSMAGIIVTTKGYWYYEYIIGTLDTANMIDGEEYCLSVKVSLAENSPYSTNQLAFFFSEYTGYKLFYNENGFYRHTIYPMLNYGNRYNNPNYGKYSSGFDSYITPLTADAEQMRDKNSWITLKNTIKYQKDHDFYFWIGGNSSDSSILTLENENQHIFNPDRTVYYYIDDIQITKVQHDTQYIQPQLVSTCNQAEYIVDLTDSLQNVVCYADSQSIPVLAGNRVIFPTGTDFSNVYIQAEYNDYCDTKLYRMVPPEEQINQKVLNQIYPNPGKQVLSYNVISGNENDQLEIDIYDATGKLVETINSILKTGLNELKFDVSDYSSGMYIFKIKDANCPTNQKVIIRNSAL
jgi:uncharacterized FlaG/YvyC family protein